MIPIDRDGEATDVREVTRKAWPARAITLAGTTRQGGARGTELASRRLASTTTSERASTHAHAHAHTQPAGASRLSGFA